MWKRNDRRHLDLMPCTYTIDSRRKLVITTASEVLTTAEAYAHQNSLAADTRFRPDFNQLLDCTEVKKFEIANEDVRNLAQRNFFGPTVRRAVVVSSTFLYGVARMLATFRDLAGGKEEIQIFQDRAEALAWLGVPPE